MREVGGEVADRVGGWEVRLSSVSEEVGLSVPGAYFEGVRGGSGLLASAMG